MPQSVTMGYYQKYDFKKFIINDDKGFFQTVFSDLLSDLAGFFVQKNYGAQTTVKMLLTSIDMFEASPNAIKNNLINYVTDLKLIDANTIQLNGMTLVKTNASDSLFKFFTEELLKEIAHNIGGVAKTLALIGGGILVAGALSVSYSALSYIRDAVESFLINGLILGFSKPVNVKFYDKNGDHASGVYYTNGMSGTSHQNEDAVRYFISQAKDEIINGGTIQIETSYFDTQLDSTYTIYNGSFTNNLVAASAATSVTDFLLTGDRKNFNAHAFAPNNPYAGGKEYYFFKDNNVALDIPVLVGGIKQVITVNNIYDGTLDSSRLMMGNGGGKNLIMNSIFSPYITGGNGSDLLLSGAGSDSLYGGMGGDTLVGGDGSDILDGGDGDDTLSGSSGSDVLTGGLGNDTFAFGIGDGMDFITDAEAGDKITINGATISGSATSLGNGLYQLGEYDLLQTGSDLYLDSKYGASVVIENFFTSGYDPKLSYSNIGITVPGTDTPVTNNEKSIVDLNVQAIPGDNVRYCPIVLDLNGDGIKYKSWTRTGYNVHFDIDNDGFAEGMEWLDANDGFLVRDLNGNGKIDNGSELFGEDGGTTAYYKLAQLDTNHDNKVDANDSGFSGLRIWQDLNSNGKTEAGELKTLVQANIKELSLQLTNNQYANDNTPINLLIKRA